MPFGIRSAQEVFHKRMHEIFKDLEVVETDIDDILVWEGHVKNTMTDYEKPYKEPESIT